MYVPGIVLQWAAAQAAMAGTVGSGAVSDGKLSASGQLHYLCSQGGFYSVSGPEPHHFSFQEPHQNEAAQQHWFCNRYR
jgi:hypothetical protein